MVLDRNDLIFTIETVLKAAGHVWRPEIEPPLPEVAADAVLLLISRKQPATPPASEPSRKAVIEADETLLRDETLRDVVIDMAEAFAYDNPTHNHTIPFDLMADFAIHFAGQRAEVAAELRAIPKQQEFGNELRALLNRYSVENESDTPDIVLSAFLVTCLNAFNASVRSRENLTKLETKNES